MIGRDELGDGTCKLVTVNGAEVAVFRRQDRIYAIQNRCPHEGGALSAGTLDGEDVICPLHGYRFNLETGACATDPGLRARTFALVPHAGGFTVEARPDRISHSA
jgi:nitrite reductase/ring-hydroxylating ferredoxin subunit